MPQISAGTGMIVLYGCCIFAIAASTSDTDVHGSITINNNKSSVDNGSLSTTGNGNGSFVTLSTNATEGQKEAPNTEPPQHNFCPLTERSDSVPKRKPKLIRKCCPISEVFIVNGTYKNCGSMPNSPPFAPDIYDRDRSCYKLFTPNLFDIVSGFNCSSRTYPTKFFLTEEGRLYTSEVLNDEKKDYKKYCIDYFTFVNDLRVFLCTDGDDSAIISETTKSRRYVKAVGLLFSCFFTILTFLVYLIVDKLRNMQGMIVMSELVCLTVAFFELSCVTIIDDMSNFQCKSAAVTVQFSFLAAFFWLNVMCFDLWLTFSGYRSFNGSIRERETKKFVTYSIYAWGCPALITGFALAVENLPSLAEYFPKPDFGERSCWFSETRALFYYFYGPMSLVLILNILMFVRTTVIIIRHKRDGKVLKRNGSQRHCSESEQQRFVVYLKLFIVMGVNWTMEVISWIFDGYDYLWCISDICNALQGVLIFMIFVCKRRVLRLLNQKLYPKKQFFPMPHHRSSSRSTSISSVGSTRMNNKNSIRVHMTDTQQYNDGDFQA